MFDSPLDWCSRCKEWIALDQTVEECARRHCCTDRDCPMIALLWAASQRPQHEAAVKRDIAPR